MELFRSQGLASAPPYASAGSRMAVGLGSRGVPAPLAAAPSAAVDLVAHPGQSIADAYDFYMGRPKQKLQGEGPDGLPGKDDPNDPFPR